MLVFFYVPCPDLDSANDVIETLLSKKLIACGNVVSSQSMFIWQGVQQKEEEYIICMKSIPALTQQIQTEILKIHPYEVPAILHWPIESNQAYEEWVAGCVTFENDDPEKPT